MINSNNGEQKYNKKEIEIMVQRAAHLIDNEIRRGAYGKEFTENKLIYDLSMEVLGDMESAIEWVFDAMDEGLWNPKMGVYAPEKKSQEVEK